MVDRTYRRSWAASICRDSRHDSQWRRLFFFGFFGEILIAASERALRIMSPEADLPFLKTV